MFSMCSELTPRAHIPDTRIPQLMQPCLKFELGVTCEGKSTLYGPTSPQKCIPTALVVLPRGFPNIATLFNCEVHIKFNSSYLVR